MTPKVVLAFAAFFAAVLSVTADGDPTISLPGVNDLTPENFDSLVNGAKHVLVEFYAPWCGHCKHLVPEYKKLGELVQADPKLKGRVVIAKVDADAHRSVGERYEVRGFPTIKFFPRGKAPTKESAVDYNGARTAEKFLEYLHEQVAADKGFARVEALDTLVKDFASAADKKAVIKQVTDAVADLSGDDKVNGDIYVKLMTKASEKGADYLTKEKARVDKMLLAGGMATAKVDELSRKSSILGALTGESA